jgi:hypothetical protein
MLCPCLEFFKRISSKQCFKIRNCPACWVEVCNSDWLTAEIAQSLLLWPRGMRTLETIEPDRVKSAVQSLADNFNRSVNWVVFSERMNRFLLWEFEDYNDYQGILDVR